MTTIVCISDPHEHLLARGRGVAAGHPIVQITV
jgi:hypothetical protein